MLNIWNLNLFRCIALIFVKEPYTNVSEIIIYKKRIYYFEEMFLKHLTMQFLEEFFLMAFWCTTISFSFAKVSEYFARLLIQITKTVERFLKVHLFSSDFNHFSRLTVFCEIFHKIFWEKFRKVEFIKREHHWLFWNVLKTLLWVNLCKNNHYFDQKQPISITCQSCWSLFRGSKLIKMCRYLLFVCINARV